VSTEETKYYKFTDVIVCSFPFFQPKFDTVVYLMSGIHLSIPCFTLLTFALVFAWQMDQEIKKYPTVMLVTWAIQ